LQKAFIEAKIGLYAFDGDKNVYTVNKIDINKVPSNGVSKTLLSINVGIYFYHFFSYK
jgi:hypothetical protein